MDLESCQEQERISDFLLISFFAIRIGMFVEVIGSHLATGLSWFFCCAQNFLAITDIVVDDDHYMKVSGGIVVIGRSRYSVWTLLLSCVLSFSFSMLQVNPYFHLFAFSRSVLVLVVIVLLYADFLGYLPRHRL